MSEETLVPWSPEWVAAHWSNGRETWLNARPGWIAGQYADTQETVLYDITIQAANSLGGLLVSLWWNAETEVEAQHWISRKALVDSQRRALDPYDRVGMVAQQEAWMEQFYSLQQRRYAHEQSEA